MQPEVLVASISSVIPSPLLASDLVLDVATRKQNQTSRKSRLWPRGNFDVCFHGVLRVDAHDALVQNVGDVQAAGVVDRSAHRPAKRDGRSVAAADCIAVAIMADVGNPIARVVVDVDAELQHVGYV